MSDQYKKDISFNYKGDDISVTVTFESDLINITRINKVNGIFNDSYRTEKAFSDAIIKELSK